jgi:hypothetical protein
MTSNDTVSAARRALNRLLRAIEKAARELDTARGALRHAEGGDFPADAFAEAGAHLDACTSFVEEQQQRLEEKILHAGGLEPGRVRRTGGQ